MKKESKMELSGFSKWKPWNKREELEGLQYPGVYALAISAEKLLDTPASLKENIVYFGMTNCSLQARLRQFDNTIRGDIGHGGAERFLRKYRSYKTLVKKLYVSVNFMECNPKAVHYEDLCKMGEVVKFEFICQAEYLRKHQRLPEFNDKKISPKLRRKKVKGEWRRY